MKTEISGAILAICAVGALAIQFWAARKPVEAKVAILRGLAEASGMIAIIAASYFLITSNKIMLPTACTFYNFLVQVALFITLPNPAARKDILSVVFAAVLFATLPMYASTNALLRTQVEMARIEERIVSILEKERGISATPSPSPSPSAHIP